MTSISGAARGIVRRAGLVAIAAVALTAATQERAQALSLATPGALPVAKYASENLIEVRGGRGGGGFHGGGGRGFHGGGGGGFRGGFHGGGMRSSGFAYRGGGYRAAHIYRGGGYRYSGLRYGGHRHAYHRPFVHRRHFHRRFYAPAYYSYPRYYPRCRIVWTYYGPRKICRYRHHYNPYRVYW
jgi:hypothetical protein